MKRLRQRYNSYKTAESEFNKKKMALRSEYGKCMNEALNSKDYSLFKDLCCDLVCDLGDEVLYIVSKMELYDLHESIKDEVIEAVYSDGRYTLK